MGQRFSGYDAPGFVGVLIPDERIVPSAMRANTGTTGDSDYTEAAPRPGRPAWQAGEVATSSPTAGQLGPHMQPEASGAQAMARTLKVIDAGHPGAGCRVVQREALDSSAPWLGYSTPNAVLRAPVGVRVVSQIATGAVLAVGNQATCTTAEGEVLFAVSSSAGVDVWSYDPAAESLSAAVRAVDFDYPAGDVDEDDAGLAPHGYSGLPPAIALLLLPSGRLMLYVQSEEIGAGAATRLQTVLAAYSDDHGATWRIATLTATPALYPVSAFDVFKMSAVWDGAGVGLFLEVVFGVGNEGLVQFGSDSDGLTFREVSSWDGTGTRGRYHSAAADLATGVVVVSYVDPADSTLKVRRVGSVFESLLGVSAVTVGTGRTLHTYTELAADSLGALCLAYTDTGYRAIGVSRSEDGGATWTTYTEHTGIVVAGSSAVRQFSLAAVGPELVYWVCDVDSDDGTGLSFYRPWHAGGWAGVSMPRVVGTEPPQSGGWHRLYLPWQTPDLAGWNTTGAGPASIVADGLQISSGVALRYYEDTATRDVDDGLLAWWSLSLASGGSLTADEVTVRVRAQATGEQHGVVARFAVVAGDLTVRLIDENGGGTLGEATVGDASAPWRFLLALRRVASSGAAQVTVYAQAQASREWAVEIYAPAVASLSTGTPTSVVRFGHEVATSNTSHWGAFGFRDGTGRTSHASLSSPGMHDDLAINVIAGAPWTLAGAPLPASPGRLMLDADHGVWSDTGPGLRGDTWHLEIDSDYPVRAVHPDVDPSPRRAHRTVADNFDAVYAWEVEGGEAAHFGSPSHGLAVFGANVPELDYIAWNGSAWVTLATLDLSAGMTGLPYVRSGSQLRVDTASSSSGSQWIAADELVGSSVRLAVGEVRKVARNTAGAWTDDDTVRPILTLEGDVSGLPSTGTLDLWYTEGAVLVHDALSAYTRFGVRIPAESTADGYYTIGSIVLGPLVVLGTKYSRNRVIEHAANVEIFTAPDGTRSARTLGPVRRTVQASWVEGFDSTPIWASGPSPDYIDIGASGSSEPLAARGDATLLEGIYRRVGGPARPLVYIPRIPTGASSTSIAGRERVFYGRFNGPPVSRQTTLGDEVSSEVVRVAGFALAEEL